MTQEFTGDSIPEAEPAFGFHAQPGDGSTTARRGQHNLPIEQRDHVPGRDGADDEGGVGPRDQVGFSLDTRERILIIQKIGGDGFRRGISSVAGELIVVLDGVRDDLVEEHWRSVS